MSNADTVNAWFSDKIATGDIALDTPAYNQAFAARSDLIERLDAGAAETPPADPVTIACVWYPQQLVCGPFARNIAAAQQAEDAKADLIGRLSGAPASKPTPAVKPTPTPQPDPEPAADAATA